MFDQASLQVLPSFWEVLSIIGGFRTLLKFPLNLWDIHTHVVVKFSLMLVVDKGICFITLIEGIIEKTCPYRVVANLIQSKLNRLIQGL